MSPSPRRRTTSSRLSTSRPRKIAGRAPVRHEPESATDDRADASVDEPVDIDPPAFDGQPVAVDESERREPVWGSASLTTVLLGALALLCAAALIGLALIAVTYLFPPTSDDGETQEAPSGEIAVPDGRPVVANQTAWRDGVEAASAAVEEISTFGWETYEEDVEAAAALATESFEPEYRETAADVRDQVMERKVTTRVSISAEGVVRANETELQALVFFTQFITREDEEEGTVNVVTSYKALVTMVHTDDGWFVDGLETDDQAATTGSPSN